MMSTERRDGALDNESATNPHTWRPSHTKMIVRLVKKSHKIGPSDSSHCMPRTMSKEPSARP
jgi:hypothetical protein